jgi:aminoglycoside phosphotransferase (APT) family kinase protein
MEARVLPVLAGGVSIGVPKPVRVLEPGPSAPFGAFAYRPLPGRLMTREDAEGPGWERIAGDAAAALASLHAFPADEALALGVPPFEFESFRELRAAVSGGHGAVSSREWAQVDGWWSGSWVTSLCCGGAGADARGPVVGNG